MAEDDTIKTMSTQSQQQPVLTCPAFLSKLWLLVDDESTDEFIHWSEEGNSFIVTDQVAFAQYLLPQFYKHNNMASFIRQLNMYGFRKKAHLDDGALKTERTDIEFQHPHFIKGEIKLLELIKRKVSGKDDTKAKGTDVGKILHEVKEMKNKQDNITSKLESMTMENTALWREVVTLRQRHEKQQKIVNRLIHFLISLVQPKVTTKRKRHDRGGQLMIEGVPQDVAPSKAKFSRTVPPVAAATISGVPTRGQKMDGNMDLLDSNSSMSLSDIIASNSQSESRVTELLEGQNSLGRFSTAGIIDVDPTATDSSNNSRENIVTRLPRETAQTTTTAAITGMPRQLKRAAKGTHESVGVAPAAESGDGGETVLLERGRDSAFASAPAKNIPVQSAKSPDISYPLTPSDAGESWDESLADVFGLGNDGFMTTTGGSVEPGVAGGGDITSDGQGGADGGPVGEEEEEEEGTGVGVQPGQGQLVLTSSSGASSLPVTTDTNPQKVVLKRVLSHEEQRQDIGEQLNIMQANLNDFQQLLSSNPTVTMELGGILNDVHGLFGDSGLLTIPDPQQNLETEETGTSSDSSGYLPPASSGNELVTYNPSTSFSPGLFMAEDEDSLLQSLDDDSAALKRQEDQDRGFDFFNS